MARYLRNGSQKKKEDTWEREKCELNRGDEVEDMHDDGKYVARLVKEARQWTSVRT